MSRACLQVCMAYQHQPTGPDVTASVEALQGKAGQLDQQASRARKALMPRPVPGQYQAVQADCASFLASMAAVPRVLSLLRAAEVRSCAGRCESQQPSAADCRALTWLATHLAARVAAGTACTHTGCSLTAMLSLCQGLEGSKQGTQANKCGLCSHCRREDQEARLRQKPGSRPRKLGADEQPSGTPITAMCWALWCWPCRRFIEAWMSCWHPPSHRMQTWARLCSS